MKKIIYTAVVIIVVMLLGIWVINAMEEGDETRKQEVKVGVLFNGSIDDMSWSQSHYTAIMETAEALDLSIIYKENVMPDQCYTTIEDFISRGCEIIICNSFDFGEGIQKAAKEHPEIYFYHATGVTGASNLTTYFGRIYQIRYLSGIVAGLQTQTNEIGYVAAFPIPEVNRGINAFTLGVRTVNPEAAVYVEWCNSWADDVLAAEATQELIGRHDIDVLAMHTDSTEPLKIADRENIQIIGYNLDNSGEYPDTYLTSAVWNWENFYTPQIRECIQGKFKADNHWEDIQSGMISLAPLTDNVKPGTEAVVEEYLERLLSGTYDVFYGPIRDSEGVVRVAEGENMSDISLLNEFDWYVEGVIINE